MTRYSFVAAVATVVLVVDQITKWYIRQNFELYQSVPVLESFFDIVHIKNTGGAFGLFAEAHSAWRLPFFVGVSTIAVVALLYFVRRIPEGYWLLLFALAGILGGALGNLIDRVVAGEVTDFLYVHYYQYYWPAFNVADSFISIGMVTLLLHSLIIGDDLPPKR